MYEGGGMESLNFYFLSPFTGFGQALGKFSEGCLELSVCFDCYITAFRVDILTPNNTSLAHLLSWIKTYFERPLTAKHSGNDEQISGHYSSIL